MRKISLKLTALATIAIFLLTLFIACNKNTDQTRLNSNSLRGNSLNDNETHPLPQGVPSNTKNYCKGCGSAYDQAFSCHNRDCVDDGGCPREVAMTFVANPTQEMVREAEEMYNLRDSFLINYDHGQDYITYYYELGTIASANNLINSSTYLEYLRFGSQLLSAANTIRYGAATDIPITASLSVTAHSFIDTFRKYTTDSVILGYMDNIETDLDDITNQSVAYIRNKLNN